jgi:hypothetical protein
MSLSQMLVLVHNSPCILAVLLSEILQVKQKPFLLTRSFGKPGSISDQLLIKFSVGLSLDRFEIW